MTKRTETYHTTDLFCDVEVDDEGTRCSQPARGPCSNCNMDICQEHGERGLSLKMQPLLLCDRCVIVTSVEMLLAIDMEKRWHIFHTRKQNVFNEVHGHPLVGVQEEVSDDDAQ